MKNAAAAPRSIVLGNNVVSLNYAVGLDVFNIGVVTQALKRAVVKLAAETREDGLEFMLWLVGKLFHSIFNSVFNSGQRASFLELDDVLIWDKVSLVAISGHQQGGWLRAPGAGRTGNGKRQKRKEK